MTISDPVLEADIHAYIDDQLDVGRRIEVEAYLSEHPAVAAQLMADLRVRDELRLALAGNRSTNRVETREAARILEGAFARRRTLELFRRAAMVALFIGAGWAAHALVGPFGATQVVASMPTPQFVREAVRAHQTALLREAMPSQAESSKYDPAEIRSSTAIILPQLPGSWSVVDAQIYPSAYGPSVEVSVEPSKGERMSLFAVRPGSFAVQQVMLVHEGDATAAYWQIGEVAYALVSEQRADGDLADTARRLARTLY
ncbi:anti-sigma factor [Rhizobium sp. RU36D]|uniref:anti-sigma factor family protein n=1 Tax=Rhizobium sp. RU36D TaxID=1907415 RepID=UPI0009D86A9D|nr:anti-sigma factor [Rhizobium sp. RU36D]SMC47573.1 Transmembrane transcriptional regulator (anti-sigma factor RsiW) [Rhizobium sp. RU36D]